MRVIDNFFKDPYTVRKLALKQSNYDPDPRFKWPGLRGVVLEPYRTIYNDYYQKFLDESVELSMMRFQTIDKSWGEGACHADAGIKYTVITYLNLECPTDSGTEVYDELSRSYQEYLNTFTSVKMDFFKSKRNFIDRFLYKKKVKKYNSKFMNPCVIPNKFNRTLIFDGERVHRAQNFFGTTLSNSRLTLISFFK